MGADAPQHEYRIAKIAVCQPFVVHILRFLLNIQVLTCAFMQDSILQIAKLLVLYRQEVIPMY